MESHNFFPGEVTIVLSAPKESHQSIRDIYRDTKKAKKQGEENTKNTYKIYTNRITANVINFSILHRHRVS